MRKIGILGGMGPEATILLQSRLLESVQANDDADHIPLLIDMNPQVPSRLTWILEKQGEDPGPVLASMAQSLAHAGAEALAMPCNTAHHFAACIEQAVDVPFFHMPKLAAAQVAERCGEGSAVGILASPATDVTGLFEGVLTPRNCRAVFPREQNILLQAIRSIKSEGINSTNTALLQSEANKLIASDVDCLLVGCSEFSLLSRTLKSSVPIIDTLDVLVDQLVEFSGAVRR